MKIYGSTVLLPALLSVGGSMWAQERSRTEMTTTPELSSVMERIEDKADVFEDKLENALDRSQVNGSDLEDMLNQLADTMEDAVDDMAERYEDKSNQEFLQNLDHAMIPAAGINRFMLRKDMSDASAEWTELRDDLNTVAKHYHRAPLPNTTTGTMIAVNADLLTKPDIVLVMERIESYTDRFEDKFRNSIQHSTLNMSDREPLYGQWADALKDTSDDMLEEFKEKDLQEFAQKLEHTMIVAEVINRIMLRSDLFDDAEVQWNAVRDDLNKVAVVFGHPVLTKNEGVSSRASL